MNDTDLNEKIKSLAFYFDDFAGIVAETGERIELAAYSFHVRAIAGEAGHVDEKERAVYINPDAGDADILHELIHVYENLIDSQLATFSRFVRDNLTWTLYTDLRADIKALDNIISAALDRARDITEAGGKHDILFLLKSIDLDLLCGYPLGTVFGYGAEEWIGGK